MDDANHINTPGAESAAGPRILRELLKTPAVKDLLALCFTDPDPETARDLAREALWDDAVFSFGALGQLPGCMNFLIAFLDELGRQLGQVPSHLLREFAGEMARNLDLESLKALPETYRPLWQTLAEGGVIDPQTAGALATALFEHLGRPPGGDPQTIEEKQAQKSRFCTEAVKAADFGKIRCAVTRRAEAAYPVAGSIVAAVVGDPVIFANLINILPPLLNNVLKLAATALKNIDFPPEILASAVFNLLGDLEAEALGDICNNTSRFINGLHEGSAVLGRTEPRFRPVLQGFLQRALSRVDEEEAAAALLALAEDGEVILCVLADTAAEKPELLEKLFSALLQGFNAHLRGLTYLLEQLNQLPPAHYAKISRELDLTDCNEIGKSINQLMKLGSRVLEENPALVEKALSSLYGSLDKEALRNFSAALLRQAAAFAAAEGFRPLLPPEEAAAALNRLLAAYNEKLAREPEPACEAPAPFLDNLDREALSRALRLSSGRIAKALSGDPRLSRSLIKSVFTIVGGALKGSLKRKDGKKSSPGIQSGAAEGRRG